ncbi:hypothetical protein [Sorangium sp. So ce854]|uniref:hypothetical protein n=1 Tax=Sorangium sp. So ce854 TaxID=3133322 RepID=UPI003F60CEF5
MKIVHGMSIVLVAVSFSSLAAAQPRPSVSRAKQFAIGLSQVRSELNVIIQKYGDRGHRPRGHEDDVKATALCMGAATDVNNAQLSAIEADGLSAFNPVAAMVAYNSACIKAASAKFKLIGAVAAALSPPVGTWLSATTDLNVTAGNLATVMTQAGCP